MSFKRGGAHKRRDAIESTVRDALHAVGVTTWQLHGAGLPDLLLARGTVPNVVFYTCEVKSPSGRLTTAQERGLWPVVRSVEDALAVVGINVPTYAREG